MPATISHAKSNTIADFSGVITVHDSTLGSVTMQASDLVRPSDWNSAHAQTLSVAGNEMYSADTYWEPYGGAYAASITVASAHSLSSIYIDPFILPVQLGSGLLHIGVSDGTTAFTNGTTYSAASTGGATRYHTMNTQVAVYSGGSGANTTRLESLWSANASICATWARSVNATTTSNLTMSNGLTLSFPTQWDASGGVTYTSTSASGTLTGNASTFAASAADSLISAIVSNYVIGGKILPIPFNTTLAAGQYHMAFNARESTSLSSNGTSAISIGLAFSTQTHMAINDANIRSFRRYGQSVTNSSSCIPLFHGLYASTTTGFPQFIATSDVRNIGSPRHLWFYYQRTSY